MLLHVYKEREKFCLNERIVAEKQQKVGGCIFLRNYLPSMIDQIAYRAYSAAVGAAKRSINGTTEFCIVTGTPEFGGRAAMLAAIASLHQ